VVRFGREHRERPGAHPGCCAAVAGRPWTERHTLGTTATSGSDTSEGQTLEPKRRRATPAPGRRGGADGRREGSDRLDQLPLRRRRRRGRIIRPIEELAQRELVADEAALGGAMPAEHCAPLGCPQVDAEAVVDDQVELAQLLAPPAPPLHGPVRALAPELLVDLVEDRPRVIEVPQRRVDEVPQLVQSRRLSLGVEAPPFEPRVDERHHDRDGGAGDDADECDRKLHRLRECLHPAADAVRPTDA
jgi:hypothetical protein